mmetsp:Transcript_8786/g.16125  ORF Transcript_8786/g.16125 Transcript_8786/m.16125 type:complete len:678 (-) Transcript_8786:147-2180(-)
MARKASKKSGGRSKEAAPMPSQPQSRPASGSGRSEKDYLSPNQLGRLLPLVPPILLLLREFDPHAADLFLSGDDVERKTINYLMSDLLNTLNFNGDMSMMELRFSFASYKIPVWLGMLREVLTGCWPRIVPDRVAADMLRTLTQLNTANSSVECAHVLGPTLDKIPRTRFKVLAEFCAFLRDTSSSTEDMACLTGPFLLCPNSAGSQDGTSVIASQTAASAAIMDMLITESELLFGRPGSAAPIGYPLGKRLDSKSKTGGAHRRSFSGSSLIRRFSLGRGAPPPGLAPAPNRSGRRPPPPPPRNKSSTLGSGSSGSKSKPMALEDKRKLGLRVFYQWRDPRRVDRVDILFNNYQFEEIALAIQRKYFGLPPGWSEQLDYLLMTGNRNLGWFSRLKQGVLPAPIESDSGRNGASNQKMTKIDKVINEITDTEIAFNKTLQDMMNCYVLKVRSIANGDQGSAAQKALGLTQAQVEHIFGPRLTRIVEVSNTLVADLEIVTLVRVQPKSGKSRIELVSRVFMENSEQLRVFGPFACAHKTAVTFIRSAREQVMGQQSSSGLRRLGSFLTADVGKNFLEIWAEESEKSNILKGQTLESILIMPVQRVPRYKLLLNELRKSTPETDSSYTQLAETCDVIKGLATDINEAIRAHERVMKRFGDDMLLPHTTTGTPKGPRNVYT